MLKKNFTDTLICQSCLFWREFTVFTLLHKKIDHNIGKFTINQVKPWYIFQGLHQPKHKNARIQWRVTVCSLTTMHIPTKLFELFHVVVSYSQYLSTSAGTNRFRNWNESKICCSLSSISSIYMNVEVRQTTRRKSWLQDMYVALVHSQLHRFSHQKSCHNQTFCKLSSFLVKKLHIFKLAPLRPYGKLKLQTSQKVSPSGILVFRWHKVSGFGFLQPRLDMGGCARATFAGYEHACHHGIL